jgi:predicted DCC family thiol-disulfide oxidoreductase YuxK
VPRDICYFDGKCGMCRRSARVIRRLDWLGRLEFRDMTAEGARDLPVAWDLAMQGMPMRTARGKVLVGFPAVRRALVQTPPGCLPALIAYIPGISHLLAWVYRGVALRRGRDECRVPGFEVAPDHAHTPPP